MKWKTNKNGMIWGYNGLNLQYNWSSEAFTVFFSDLRHSSTVQLPKNWMLA